VYNKSDVPLLDFFCKSQVKTVRLSGGFSRVFYYLKFHLKTVYYFIGYCRGLRPGLAVMNQYPIIEQYYIAIIFITFLKYALHNRSTLAHRPIFIAEDSLSSKVIIKNIKEHNSRFHPQSNSSDQFSAIRSSKLLKHSK